MRVPGATLALEKQPMTQRLTGHLSSKTTAGVGTVGTVKATEKPAPNPLETPLNWSGAPSINTSAFHR